MRRLGNALVARLASLIIFGVTTPAIAQTYPICLAGGPGNTLRCDYANLEQCQASASGGLGYCVGNPASSANAFANYRGARSQPNLSKRGTDITHR